MNAEEKLQKLLEHGIISAEQLRKLEMENEKELHACAEALHSIQCTLDHSKDCLWYEEEQLDTRWDGFSHRYWLNVTKRLCQQFKLSPDEMFKCIQQALAVRQFFQSLDFSWEQEPAILHFLKELLFGDASIP